MRNVAIGTLGLLALLCLGAKPKPPILEMPNKPPSGGRIRIQIPSWGSSWDWNQDGHLIPPPVLHAIHRGLYRLGESGALERDLAESETASADALIWTFRIRSGIKWSDGAPLLAKHFADGLIRAADPDLAKLPTILKNVQGAEKYHSRQSVEPPAIRVLSERVFEVRLSRPDPLFALKWLDPRLMPARGDLIQANTTSYGFVPEQMAFLGRMMLQDSRPGLRTLMVPNPQHPHPGSISVAELWHVPDPAQSRSLFDRAHLDVALGALPGVKTGKTWQSESNDFVALVPQSARAKTREVMLAVSLALNRSALPGIRGSLDWVPSRLWKLQGSGEYPAGIRPEDLGGQSARQHSRLNFTTPMLIRSELQDAALEKAIEKNLSSVLKTRIQVVRAARLQNKAEKPADFVLRRWSDLPLSLEAYLVELTGDETWLSWNELPQSDPKRTAEFTERTRKALIDSPILIPVGFALRTVQAKSYLKPLEFSDAGDVDLARLSFESSPPAKKKR